MSNLQFTADADDEGNRLDRFLAGEIPDQSRSQIQRLIEAGHVTHSRVKTVKANSEVREGDVVSVEVPGAIATEALAEDIPLDILFNDRDIVVVNKPSGMVVHPAAGNHSGTLVNALLHHIKDLSGIGGEIRPGIALGVIEGCTVPTELVIEGIHPRVVLLADVAGPRLLQGAGRR